MTLEEIESYSPGDYFYDVADQLKRHVYERSIRAFAAGDAARDAVSTSQALTVRQQAARTCLLSGIGGLPPLDTPLHAQTVGEVSAGDFRVERVVFQSRPGHYVTANLYLPNDVREPTGAVLFLCGHHREAKHVPEYQAVCQYLAQAGLLVLAQDPIGQGERLGYYEPSAGDSNVIWGTNEHDYAGAQCWPLGDGLARYFLHDAMRGIDYLATRPEVDPRRIGVTGNSGGGTQSSLLMLADPRIAAAAPTTFIMSRETYLLAGGAQDAEQIWPGFTEAGFDHEDIVLALAPKPVRVLAVTSDFFPIEGTRRTVARCKRLWGLFGKSDHVDLVEDVSGHSYTPPLARAAAQFFARHLLDKEHEPDDGRIAPIEPQKLWCTASGQVRGEMQGAASVHEANQERLAESEAGRHAVNPPERQAEARAWLRRRVFANRRPCDLNPRFLGRGAVEGLSIERALWWSQPDLFSFGVLFRDARRSEHLPVTLAVWDSGTGALRPHWEWLRDTCATGRAVLVLDVSGVGALLPRPITRGDPEGFYGVIHKLATDLFWLGDDMVSLRTHDVLRALDMIAAWPGLDPDDTQVYAHGRLGLYGRLAAILDDRIQRVVVEAAPQAWADWVGARRYEARNIYSAILPGMLRHFDLPDFEGEG